MKPNPAKLFIFTALECEAKGLINHFKLKKDNTSHPFSMYGNDEVILTVTGVGKVAMAGGVAYVLARFSSVKAPVLVNIGIAGHKTQVIGDLLIASKISDAESLKVFYPQLIGANWPESSEIKSTALPNTDYVDNCLNDMEASAFYEIAVKFSSSELIHCLKVVSDNEQTSIDGINAKRVVNWISNQLTSIEKTFNHLQQLREIIVPIESTEYKTIIDKWHFSVSGKVKLKSLLRRWNALSSNDWLTNSSIDLKTGKEVIYQLTLDIERLGINL